MDTLEPMDTEDESLRLALQLQQEELQWHRLQSSAVATSEEEMLRLGGIQS